MSRDWRLFLDDIVECSRRVLDYTRGMSLDDFVQDTRTYDAVLRNLEIIGEAAKRLPEEVRQQHPQIPWRQISRFRDRLAHGYRTLDDAIVWSAIRSDVAPLLHEVQSILERSDGST